MKLTEYIDKYYNGSKAEFARANGVLPQRVTEWVNGDFIVVDGKLYSQRRDLAPVELKK
ncbi:hypothetical protein G6162_001526 [Salmonella enterica]|nr:hypothetical protein [Salmonella enterica subsp. arizonae serovar 48:z4,z24:-]EHJ9658203.1 hypothetical protein [Salmonella enterica]EHK4225448.1 hypothetical protein [Salmonella enterica]EHL3531844.1 hypothetical protein [Salmonella enterica]EHQ5247127.1 hypothetical protein [Salmonella enterica]